MIEFYLRLLVAGILSLMLLTLTTQFVGWIKFVVVGWRITKPLRSLARNDQPVGSSTPDLIVSSLSYALSLTVFVVALVKIDIPSMPDSLKVITSLALAEVASVIPMQYGSLRKSLQASKNWIYVLLPLYLILTVTVGTIVCVPLLALSFIWVVHNLVRARATSEKGFVHQLQDSQNNLMMELERLSSPRRLFTADLTSFIVLAGAYWLFGFRDNLVLFIAPALLLVIGNRMFSYLVSRMRKLDDPAEVRAVNPVAFAGSLIILFSFYIALLLNHPEQTTTYLMASALFLAVLWYFCYLSRRETTIEVAQQAYASKDYDFQVDSTNSLLAIFSRLIWILHPVFFAIALHRSGGTGNLLLVNAWFDSMKVVVIVTLIYTLTCLVIWTRNIRAPKLKVAGDRRPDYPEYRDNLAASALPYCVVIPALLYAFLNLMGLSPIHLPGIEGSIWLEITIYFALTLVLIGFFVQLPYRSGARAWKSPILEQLEKQIEQIRSDIELRRENLLKSRGSAVAMKNISDELTLYRMRNEAENESKARKLTYNITWPGEIGKDSALYFVLSFVASAITTVIATNLDSIIQLLLKIPK